MDWVNVIAGGILLILLATSIGVFSTLSTKDTAQNTKIKSVVIGFSVAAAIVSYGLALYYFRPNPAMLLQFLLALTMLVILPASLISVGFSTIYISELRDAAAGTSA